MPFCPLIFESAWAGLLTLYAAEASHARPLVGL